MPSETFGSQAISGVITVTTAGTAVNGTDVKTPNGVFIHAAGANTGYMYVGNDGAGDVASTNGFELSAGQTILIMVASLKDVWVDSSVNGEKVSWLKA